jgi:hypothetical protein
MPVIAVLDANVLYSAPARNLLLYLAFSGVFQARWSAEIENEWTRNPLEDRPELATATADVIVTFNLKDFPVSAQPKYRE